MLLFYYPNKKALKASVGQELKYEETSMFGTEFKSNGNVVGANYPHMTHMGTEFFANIDMVDGKISKVH